MAHKRATSAVAPPVFKLDSRSQCPARRAYNRPVEVDQIAVIAATCSHAVDPMGVMTCGTWRPPAGNVQVMQGEALVAKDALTAMAAIT